MAAANVFNQAQTFGGSFLAKYSKVEFGGLYAGHLAQQVQFQYQQSVTMVYELGSERVYYVGGRAQGTATVSRLIGPIGVDITAMYSDMCVPGKIVVSADSGCPAAPVATAGQSSSGSNTPPLVRGKTYTLDGAVLTALAGTQSSQDVIFTETLSFMFLNLAVAAGVPNRATTTTTNTNPIV